MKTVTVSIENKQVTINNETCNFYEAGLENAHDIDDVREHLEERHPNHKIVIEKYDDLEKVLDHAEKNNDFVRGCGDEAMFRFSFKELEDLGWDFDPDYDAISEAQGISYEDAIKYNDENESVIIVVDELGRTKWHSVCDNPQSRYYNESSDNKETGDDNKTILDIIKLKEI